MERQAVAKAQKRASRSKPLQRQSAGPSSAGHPLLELQRSIGNQAVQRLIRSYIQTKLQVSTPGDPFEQEADRVADTVMRITEPELPEEEGTPVQTKPLATQITPLVQRESEQLLEEEKVEAVATKPLVRVPVAVREDDDEEKVAPKLDTNPSPQDEQEERTVETKLAKDTPLLRQAREEEEQKEETLQIAPPIQRQIEEEDQEEVQTKPLSSQLSQPPGISPLPGSSPGRPIQRVCAECEGGKQRQEGQPGEMVHRTSAPEQLPDDDDLEQRVQPKGAQTPTPKVTAPVAASIHAFNGGGSPLPDTTRAFFEPRLGADFSQVRVHTDSRAAETANSINARAFTVGQNIAFGTGRYAPHSHAGRQLLAHELTHVVQQGGGSRSRGVVPISPVTKSRGLLQRWGELEHKTVGNRAQNEFPYRGTILTNMTALRATPRKNLTAPYNNIKADILSGAAVLVLGKERGWVQVLVESGTAQDNKGRTVSAETMTGYVSQELITKSGAVFDAEVPVGGGLNLSYGDLLAFGGDHFKDFAQIADEAKTAAGRARLKKLRDTIDSEATQSPAYEDSATISKEYAERYKNLALENVSHFLHGGTALTTWQKMHSEAIVNALEAGKEGDSAGLAKAYALNGFADHFLTDSFSSGHVRVPREAIILYYKKLARDVFQQIIDYLSDRLGSRIYELLRQDYRRVRWFGDEGHRQRAITMARDRLVQRITEAGGPAKVQETFGLYVAGAFSGILHDRENKQGLNVVSKKHPEGWTALGDRSLNVPANAKNLAYMTEAVQASKEDLLNAFKIGLDVLTRHGKAPPQAAIDAAMADITKKVGPPYVALEFVPSPAPGVKPLPAWEWGNLDKTLQTELVGVIAKYITADAQNELLMQVPPREDIEIDWAPDVVARPGDAARDILNEALADPVRFLEQAFGRAAAP